MKTIAMMIKMSAVIALISHSYVYDHHKLFRKKEE